MKVRQKKTRKTVAMLLMMVLFTGTTAIPCGASEVMTDTSENILIALKEGTNESEETQKEQIDQPEEEPKKPAEKSKPVQLKQPTAFQAEAVKNGIQLSWKKVSKAQKYEIYRKVSGADGGYTLIKLTKKSTYTDRTAEYGVTYLYRVRAIAVSGGKTYKSVLSEKARCYTYFVDPSKPMVALTFDDGPSQYTAGILDSLEKYHSRATFFEVGYRVNQYKDTVLRIDQLGCEIGNHSYDHASLGNASASKIRSEISKTDARIKAVTGKKPTLLRPPYGNRGSSLKQNAGKPMILWSIDTRDWESRNADKVCRIVMNQVSDGDIILMHDAYSSSRDAAKRIIPALKRKGYQLVTISELAQYKKVTLTAGNSYFQM